MPERSDLGEVLTSARAAVAEHIERSGTVGVSMSVVIGKDVVARWAFGHAHTESEGAMEPSTVSDIGSVTKTFTATLLMILRDEGLVNLDDPVEAHWPPFEPISRLSDDRPITLRQLATHTSGIAFRQMFLPSEQPPGSVDELVAQLADRGLVFPPGAGHKYSNAAFQILGEIVAARSGMPFASLLHERLLEPLGMVDTTFEVASFDPERLAFGYRRGAPRGIPLETRQPIMGDGGLVSTVDDLARFLSLQWQARPDVLSPTTVRELLAPAYLDPQWGWAQAIGWRLEPEVGHTLVSHAGAMAKLVDGVEGEWRALVASVPDVEVGVAVLVNCDTNPGPLCRLVIQAVVPEVAARRAAELAERAKPFAWCTGSYRWAEGDFALDAHVELADGGLSATITGAMADTWQLVPIADECFRATTGHLAGEVAAFERSNRQSPASAFRLGPLLFSRRGTR